MISVREGLHRRAIQLDAEAVQESNEFEVGYNRGLEGLPNEAHPASARPIYFVGWLEGRLQRALILHRTGNGAERVHG